MGIMQNFRARMGTSFPDKETIVRRAKNRSQN